MEHARSRGSKNGQQRHDMMDPHATTRVESRLSIVEAGYRTLSEDVAKLSMRLDNYATSTQAAIKELGSALSESQQTPWSTLAAWAGVVLTIVSIGGFGYVREIDRLDSEQIKLADQVRIHHESPGHAASLQLHEISMKHMEDNDEKLRTMIAQTMEASSKLVEAQDTTLQREMRLLNDSQDQKLAQIEKRLERIEAKAERYPYKPPNGD